MLAVTYYVMLDTSTSLDEDKQKARESFKKIFRAAQFEEDTGLPAAALAMGVMPFDMPELPTPPRD
jgi:aconitase B